jgi:hypothetical protein
MLFSLVRRLSCELSSKTLPFDHVAIYLGGSHSMLSVAFFSIANLQFWGPLGRNHWLTIDSPIALPSVFPAVLSNSK